jgi:hypothetical protein
MKLTTPTYNTLSTLPDPINASGSMTNAGMEIGIVNVGVNIKVHNGVRPNGTSGKVPRSTDARTGSFSLKVEDIMNGGPWGNWATLVSQGKTITVSSLMKGNVVGSGKLKIQAMDRDQATLATNEGIKNVTTSWAQYSTQLIIPSNADTLWIFFTSEGGKSKTVFFDDITITIT